MKIIITLLITINLLYSLNNDREKASIDRIVDQLSHPNKFAFKGLKNPFTGFSRVKKGQVKTPTKVHKPVFIPQITKQKRIVITFKGVLNSKAFINNKLYKEGANLYGSTLSQIRPKYIIINSANGSEKVKLGQRHNIYIQSENP